MKTRAVTGTEIGDDQLGLGKVRGRGWGKSQKPENGENTFLNFAPKMLENKLRSHFPAKIDLFKY